MVTADFYIRYVLLPALGAAAVVALVITLREQWKAYKAGEWDSRPVDRDGSWRW